MRDIERLAREAGFVVDEQAKQHQPNRIFTHTHTHTHYMVDELLQRFAALVRNEVLEEAAKVCDKQDADFEYDALACHCSVAIRSLKTDPNEKLTR